MVRILQVCAAMACMVMSYSALGVEKGHVPRAMAFPPHAGTFAWQRLETVQALDRFVRSVMDPGLSPEEQVRRLASLDWDSFIRLTTHTGKHGPEPYSTNVRRALERFEEDDLLKAKWWSAILADPEAASSLAPRTRSPLFLQHPLEPGAVGTTPRETLQLWISERLTRLGVLARFPAQMRRASLGDAALAERIAELGKLSRALQALEGGRAQGLGTVAREEWMGAKHVPNGTPGPTDGIGTWGRHYIQSPGAFNATVEKHRGQMDGVLAALRERMPGGNGKYDFPPAAVVYVAIERALLATGGLFSRALADDGSAGALGKRWIDPHQALGELVQDLRPAALRKELGSLSGKSLAWLDASLRRDLTLLQAFGTTAQTDARFALLHQLWLTREAPGPWGGPEPAIFHGVENSAGIQKKHRLGDPVRIFPTGEYADLLHYRGEHSGWSASPSLLRRENHVALTGDELAFLRRWPELSPSARRNALMAMPLPALVDLRKRLVGERADPPGVSGTTWRTTVEQAIAEMRAIELSPLRHSQMWLKLLSDPSRRYLPGTATARKRLDEVSRQIVKGHAEVPEKVGGRSELAKQLLAEHEQLKGFLAIPLPAGGLYVGATREGYASLFRYAPEVFATRLDGLALEKRIALAKEFFRPPGPRGDEVVLAAILDTIPEGQRPTAPAVTREDENRLTDAWGKFYAVGRKAHDDHADKNDYQKVLATMGAVPAVFPELHGIYRQLGTEPPAILRELPGDARFAKFLPRLDTPEGIHEMIAKVTPDGAAEAHAYFLAKGAHARFHANSRGRDADAALVARPFRAARTALALRHAPLDKGDRDVADALWRLSRTQLRKLVDDQMKDRTGWSILPECFKGFERVRRAMAEQGLEVTEPIEEMAERVVEIFHEKMDGIRALVKAGNYSDLKQEAKKIFDESFLVPFDVLRNGERHVTPAVAAAVRGAWAERAPELSLIFAVLDPNRERAVTYRDFVVLPPLNGSPSEVAAKGPRIRTWLEYRELVHDRVDRFNWMLGSFDQASVKAGTVSNFAGKLFAPDWETRPDRSLAHFRRVLDHDYVELRQNYGVPQELIDAMRVSLNRVTTADYHRQGEARNGFTTAAIAAGAFALTLPVSIYLTPALAIAPIAGAVFGTAHQYALQRAQITDRKRVEYNWDEIWESGATGFGIGAAVAASGPLAPYVTTVLGVAGTGMSAAQALQSYLNDDLAQAAVHGTTALYLGQASGKRIFGAGPAGGPLGASAGGPPGPSVGRLPSGSGGAGPAYPGSGHGGPGFPPPGGAQKGGNGVHSLAELLGRTRLVGNAATGQVPARGAGIGNAGAAPRAQQGAVGANGSPGPVRATQVLVPPTGEVAVPPVSHSGVAPKWTALVQRPPTSPGTRSPEAIPPFLPLPGKHWPGISPSPVLPPGKTTVDLPEVPVGPHGKTIAPTTDPKFLPGGRELTETESDRLRKRLRETMPPWTTEKELRQLFELVRRIVEELKRQGLFFFTPAGKLTELGERTLRERLRRAGLALPQIHAVLSALAGFTARDPLVRPGPGGGGKAEPVAWSEALATLLAKTAVTEHQREWILGASSLGLTEFRLAEVLGSELGGEMFRDLLALLGIAIAGVSHDKSSDRQRAIARALDEFFAGGVPGDGGGPYHEALMSLVTERFGPKGAETIRALARDLAKLTTGPVYSTIVPRPDLPSAPLAFTIRNAETGAHVTGHFEDDGTVVIVGADGRTIRLPPPARADGPAAPQVGGPPVPPRQQPIADYIVHEFLGRVVTFVTRDGRFHTGRFEGLTADGQSVQLRTDGEDPLLVLNMSDLNLDEVRIGRSNPRLHSFAPEDTVALFPTGNGRPWNGRILAYSDDGTILHLHTANGVESIPVADVGRTMLGSRGARTERAARAPDATLAVPSPGPARNQARAAQILAILETGPVAELVSQGKYAEAWELAIERLCALGIRIEMTRRFDFARASLLANRNLLSEFRALLRGSSVHENETHLLKITTAYVTIPGTQGPIPLSQALQRRGLTGINGAGRLLAQEMMRDLFQVLHEEAWHAFDHDMGRSHMLPLTRLYFRRASEGNPATDPVLTDLARALSTPGNPVSPARALHELIAQRLDGNGDTLVHEINYLEYQLFYNPAQPLRHPTDLEDFLERHRPERVPALRSFIDHLLRNVGSTPIARPAPGTVLIAGTSPGTDNARDVPDLSQLRPHLGLVVTVVTRTGVFHTGKLEGVSADGTSLSLRPRGAAAPISLSIADLDLSQVRLGRSHPRLHRYDPEDTITVYPVAPGPNRNGSVMGYTETGLIYFQDVTGHISLVSPADLLLDRTIFVRRGPPPPPPPAPAATGPLVLPTGPPRNQARARALLSLLETSPAATQAAAGNHADAWDHLVPALRAAGVVVSYHSAYRFEYSLAELNDPANAVTAPGRDTLLKAFLRRQNGGHQETYGRASRLEIPTVFVTIPGEGPVRLDVALRRGLLAGQARALGERMMEEIYETLHEEAWHAVNADMGPMYILPLTRAYINRASAANAATDPILIEIARALSTPLRPVTPANALAEIVARPPVNGRLRTLIYELNYLEYQLAYNPARPFRAIGDLERFLDNHGTVRRPALLSFAAHLAEQIRNRREDPFPAPAPGAVLNIPGSP